MTCYWRVSSIPIPSKARLQISNNSTRTLPGIEPLRHAFCPAEDNQSALRARGFICPYHSAIPSIVSSSVQFTEEGRRRRTSRRPFCPLAYSVLSFVRAQPTALTALPWSREKERGRRWRPRALPYMSQVCWIVFGTCGNLPTLANTSLYLAKL